MVYYYDISLHSPFSIAHFPQSSIVCVYSTSYAAIARPPLQQVAPDITLRADERSTKLLRVTTPKRRPSKNIDTWSSANLIPGPSIYGWNGRSKEGKSASRRYSVTCMPRVLRRIVSMLFARASKGLLDLPNLPTRCALGKDASDRTSALSNN